MPTTWPSCLAELARVGADAPERRHAKFRCVAMVAYPDGTDVWEAGEVAGRIAPQAMGGSGFGYDPVFAPDGFEGRTFAQMTADEKHGSPIGAGPSGRWRPDWAGLTGPPDRRPRRVAS